VQKSGRLTDHSLDLLVRCGLKLSRGKDQLMGYGENMPLDVLFVRDDDIPDLVQEDVCDLGLVGLNVIEEKRLELAARGTAARFEVLRSLDFGRCRLSIAVPDGTERRRAAVARGKRIATTYPLPARRFLAERGIERRDRHALGRGRDRAAPRPRRPDLRPGVDWLHAAANHLHEVETVLESQAVLIRTPVALPEIKDDWVERLLMRIDGVQQVKESKYIMLHAPRSALPRSASCCPAASRRRSFRSRATRTRWRCTPCAARTCSGKRSRA
jgi:ATP phosphoribosyltransferase